MRVQSAVSLILFVIIILALACIPYADGYLFKDNYLKMLAVVSKEKHIDIKVLDYKLGWLSSTAKIQIQQSFSDQPELAQLPPQIYIIDQKIEHGPFLLNPITASWTFAQAAISTDLSLPVMLKTILVNASNRSDIHIDTVVTGLGDYQNHITSAAFTLAPIPGMPKITWAGFRGDMTFTMSHEHLKTSQGSYVLSGINFKDEKHTLTVSDNTYEYNLVRNSVDLWDGSAGLLMPSFSFTNTDGFFIKLANFRYNVEMNSQTNQFYNVIGQTSVDSLVMPEYSVSPSSIKVGFNHLNPQGIKDFKQHMMDPQKALASLMTPTFSMSSDIALHTTLGNFAETSEMNWPANAPTDSMDKFLNSAYVKINLRVSEGFLNKLIELQFGAESSSAPSTATVMSTDQLNDDSITKQINAWAKQNMIPLDTSLRLVDLIGTHLKAADFAKNIDQYVMRKEIAANYAVILKTEYNQVHPEANVKPAVPAAPNAVAAAKPIASPVAQPPAPAVVVKKSPAEMVHQQINDWVAKGYIKLDQGDYVTVITREQGIVKLNGQVVPNDVLLNAVPH